MMTRIAPFMNALTASYFNSSIFSKCTQRRMLSKTKVLEYLHPEDIIHIQSLPKIQPLTIEKAVQRLEFLRKVLKLNIYNNSTELCGYSHKLNDIDIVLNAVQSEEMPIEEAKNRIECYAISSKLNYLLSHIISEEEDSKRMKTILRIEKYLGKQEELIEEKCDIEVRRHFRLLTQETLSATKREIWETKARRILLQIGTISLTYTFLVPDIEQFF